jgi:hypothetical protein
MAGRQRWIAPLVGFVLVVGGATFTLVKLAPCAFADSRPPTEGIIALAERWLEVDGPVPDGPGLRSDGSGNASVELLVRSLSRDGDPDSGVVAERVAILDDLLREIRSALDDGSRVFLALASSGLEREQAAYAVARRTDGTHEILSGCGFDLTAEARGMLGTRYDEAMRRIIGVTDSDSIYRILADVRDAPGHMLLEYEERPPDLRLFERTGTLVERGACLAIETEVGPLVPIWAEQHFLALDDEGLVVMEGLGRGPRPGDRLVLSGREMSPTEALAITDRASLRRCPGRLILVGRASRTTAAA